MSDRSQDPRVIVALDFPDADKALEFAGKVEASECRLKIGKELFTAAGPVLVEQLRKRGFGIFLDLKYHDIPNTVAAACRVAAELGVWMVNVHASGGSRMMAAAREALQQVRQPPLLIAVTVLTSLSDEDLSEIGFQGDARSNVLRLAKLAEGCGLDGVVCSAMEVADLRAMFPGKFALVTPGIRPRGTASDDQQRIMTPREAILAGSDYLVIGRPITLAKDPQEALAEINQEIASAV
ncbi:MAG: orotidine-5'-phosphate decarboxylase [Gammaproteobacteria bacterium]